MDSPIALALMTKIKAVFEREDTFLSFPLIPIARARENMNFSLGTLTVEEWRCWSEFSRFVDIIPRDIVWMQESDIRLSAIYREAVESAISAKSNRTAEEEAEYQKARGFLTVFSAEGEPQDSPELIAYNQHKDLFFIADEEYRTKKFTAENSGDAIIKQKWQELEEPLALEKLKQVEGLWETHGFKNEIEEVLQILKRLGGKSPGKTLDDWNMPFISNMAEKTDPDGKAFSPGSYAPSNALDEGSWLKFPLNGNEIGTLISQSPDELRQRLAPNAVDLEIENLSFEVSSAKINRPWFSPELFDARFWKFSDDSKILSDGTTEFKGLCPAFVAGIVFARNIEVKLKQNSSINKVALDFIKLNNGLSFGMFEIAPPPVESTGTSAFLLKGANFQFANFNSNNPPTAPVAHPLGGSTGFVLNSNFTAHHLQPEPNFLMSKKLLGQDFFRLEMEDEPPATEDPEPVDEPLLDASGATIEGASPTAGTGTTNQPETPTTTVDTGIYILAFICKKVPKSPNPDPNLQW